MDKIRQLIDSDIPDDINLGLILYYKEFGFPIITDDSHMPYLELERKSPSKYGMTFFFKDSLVWLGKGKGKFRCSKYWVKELIHFDNTDL